MIYFDNAATSFPKPNAVSDEVYKCITQYCGNPGRAGHRMSIAAAEKVYECREMAAELFGLGDPTGVIFTLNTTHALNIAIKGCMHRGGHVIISDMEHNSVYRVIRKYADAGFIRYDIFDSGVLHTDRSAERICASISSLVRPETELIICTHASNVCSAVMPIKEIGDLCGRINAERARSGGVRICFIVDGAASAGHVPINMASMGINALALPSHKGLYGPQGCGILLLRGLKPDTLIEGGNGVRSLEPDMGDELPERYEAGTVATPAIAGLCEGMRYVRSIGISRIAEHEAALYSQTLRLIGSLPYVQVYGASHVGATLLFNMKGLEADDVGMRLDRYGICVRSGYHCAPLAHRTLHTPPGGAVRLSFGIYNTPRQVIALYEALKRIADEAYR
ncbi:MAG: aminotransferase class V-fold PLP-dependent enzyme [Clostridia bacterium]|nr:aminotransferase class V-fold PLP-dependent enzyme [Clostridia bacterium]